MLFDNGSSGRIADLRILIEDFLFRPAARLFDVLFDVDDCHSKRRTDASQERS